MATEIYIGEEFTKRKTKCRSCSEYLSKGEKRVAVEYDPYTYTTSKHTFMNYYHPKCWEEKNKTKQESQEKKRSLLPIFIVVGIVLFFISKILFLATLFISLAIGLAYVLHKNSN